MRRLSPTCAALLLAALWLAAACEGDDAAAPFPGGSGPSGPPCLAPPPPAAVMYRQSPQHLGVAPPTERLAIPPTRRWTAGPVNVGIHTASKSSPVADDTQVYVGADNERLHAFDRVTGEHRWTWHSRPCRFGVHATPAVDEAHVYIGDYAGWLTAVDKATGALVWETRLGDSIGASPVLVGDRVYVGVESGAPNGWLAAVDRATGEEVLRSAPFGDHTHATPSFDAGACTAFLGSNRGLFLAIDALTGAERWSFAPVGALDPWPRAGARPDYHAQIKSTAAVVGDRVLFTSWDRHLYCVDAATGAELWRYETDHRTMSSPTVDAVSGRVFVGSHDRAVHAVDLRTGQRLWRRETGARVISSGVLVARRDGGGAVLVIGSSDGHVYALDAATGAVAWSGALRGAITSVPLVHDGRLYVSSDGGDLVCWE